MSEESFGEKGAFSFRWRSAYQLSPSNQGCSLISRGEAWPSLFFGSFASIRLIKSWSLIGNLIIIYLRAYNLVFYKRCFKKAPSYFNYEKEVIQESSHKLSTPSTTNPHQLHALFSLLFMVLDTRVFHKSKSYFRRYPTLLIVQSQLIWYIQLDQWWCFPA